MSFTHFTTQKNYSFVGKYSELTPGKCIRYTDQFEDPNMPGQMQVTVLLNEVVCGTEISITQDGIPDMIPAALCYLGWQESLMQLAQAAGYELGNQ